MSLCHQLTTTYGWRRFQAIDGQQQSPLFQNSFYTDVPSCGKVERSLKAGTERPLKAGAKRSLKAGAERPLKAGTERPLKARAERPLKAGKASATTKQNSGGPSTTTKSRSSLPQRIPDDFIRTFSKVTSITRGRRIMGTKKTCRGGENRGLVISHPEVRPKDRAARKDKRVLRPVRLCAATTTAGEDSSKDAVRSGRKDGRGSDYGSSCDYSRLRRHWRNKRQDGGGLGLAGATQGRALLTDDESPDDRAMVRRQVMFENFKRGAVEPKENRQYRRKSIVPRPSLTRKGGGSRRARFGSSSQPYRAYEVAAKPAAPLKLVRKGELLLVLIICDTAKYYSIHQEKA